MVRKEKAVWLVLGAACLASVIIPVKGLLIDGVYGWHIRQPEFIKMMLEIMVLAVLFAGIALWGKGGKRKLAAAGGICLVFIWCHVMLLPVLVSGLYALYLYVIGYCIRTRVFKYKVKSHGFADFLLGCAGVITLFCIMSAAGAGSIGWLRMAVLLTGAAAAALSIPSFKIWYEDGRREQKRLEPAKKLTKPELLLLVLMIVMVLIQIGRMNISIDFDSLWYGVRSEYILDNGRGIYENSGSVGLVYTYSKGLEVLLLPLSDLASHSYLICFNVWMAVMTLAAVYRVGRCYMKRRYAMIAAAAVSTVPAVMNMSITAKTDSMTLLVQMVMILYVLYYLQDKKVIHLLTGAAAMLLSWTLKPTAVVFSTAVFGMSFLYLLVTRQFSLKTSWRNWLSVLPAFLALIGIWARTWLIVGIPVTSVFSSIFLKLGFSLNYPFSILPLYGGGAGDMPLPVYLLDVICKMLLLPVGENMSHVVFAWGTSLIFFLIIAALLLSMVKKNKPEADRNLVNYAHVVLAPFLLVCLISLLMLGQIDGNYFMLLDVMAVLYGIGIISTVKRNRLRKSIVVMLLPILLLNLNMTAVSNWAWSLGFTPVQIVNKGRINHEELQRRRMAELGNAGIWDILEEDPQTRVIAAGNHPLVFNFPCNVQSYDDIASSWGNMLLVKTMDNFVEYLEYAKTDYVYMQAGTVNRESRCYELMGYLIEAGILTDVIYENGNMLAKVEPEGTYGQEASEEYERYFESYQAE